MQFRVPGSTSNLGHGFDCLGMALGIHNVISVAVAESETAAHHAHTGLDRLTGAVQELAMQQWGVQLPPISVTVTGDVPIARGLGSSATIIVGVAAACQQLAGLPFDKDAILPLGVAIEGHPDNIAAACYGGFTIAAPLTSGLSCKTMAVPAHMRAVVAIPNFEVSTASARQVLPDRLLKDEAIRGWQRTALIVAALANGDLDGMRECFDDAWHEHWRADLNPGLTEARHAAQEAGAIGTILSGSGSCVLSFCDDTTASATRDAMHASYEAKGIEASLHILEVDNEGCVRLDI